MNTQSRPPGQEGKSKNVREWVVLGPELRQDTVNLRHSLYASSSNDNVSRAQEVSLFSRLGKSRGESDLPEHPDSDGGKILTTGGAGRARARRKRIAGLGTLAWSGVDR